MKGLGTCSIQEVLRANKSYLPYSKANNKTLSLNNLKISLGKIKHYHLCE